MTSKETMVIGEELPSPGQVSNKHVCSWLTVRWDVFCFSVMTVAHQHQHHWKELGSYVPFHTEVHYGSILFFLSMKARGITECNCKRIVSLMCILGKPISGGRCCNMTHVTFSFVLSWSEDILDLYLIRFSLKRWCCIPTLQIFFFYEVRGRGKDRRWEVLLFRYFVLVYSPQ